MASYYIDQLASHCSYQLATYCSYQLAQSRIIQASNHPEIIPILQPAESLNIFVGKTCASNKVADSASRPFVRDAQILEFDQLTSSNPTTNTRIGN